MRVAHSVAARFALSFALVIVVFGVAVTLGIARLAAFNRSVSEVTGSELRKIETVDDWLLAISETNRHTRNMLILDEKAKVQAEIDAVRGLWTKRRGFIDSMSRAVQTPEERSLLEAVVQEAKNNVFPAEEQYVKEIEAGDFKTAKQTLLERARPAQLQVMAALQRFDEFERQEMKGKADAVAASYQSTRTSIILLSLAAVVAAAAMAYFLTRRIRDPLLRILGYFGELRRGNFRNAIDVTSRDEIGQVLVSLRETQQALLDASIQAHDYEGQIAAISKSQGVIEFELDGTIRAANDNFLRLVGYPREQLVGRHHNDLVEIAYRETAEYERFWEKLRRGEYDAGVYKRVGSGGREIWIQASYNPVLDLEGKPFKVVKYAADVTEQVRMRQSLDAAVQETQAVVRAAIDGDLTQRISAQGKSGHIEALTASVNQLLESVSGLVRTMSQAAGEVRLGAQEIARGNANLSQRTEEQASSLEETASSMEEMTSTVRQSADNAGEANELAAATRSQAERGGMVVSAAVAAMDEINQSSKRIADIIGVIDEIAFQTNLLALNAAVEAARAGEQGRGFAVVASEVRGLASRSAEAAKEIKGLIQDSVRKVSEGAKLVDESGQVLSDIVGRVQKVTNVMTEIAGSSREQAIGIEQVNKAIATMESVTQQNAALVEEVSAAAETLNEQATNLNQLISRYRIEGASQGTTVVPAATLSERRATRRSAGGAKV